MRWHDTPPAIDSTRASLRELAGVFLRLGTTAFGGPAAHIAMMEQEVVHRRRWMTHEDFLDLIGVTNLIPGPNSTEMAIHIGLRRAGWAGLLVAGSCFILPAFFIVLGCAWFYARYAQLPALQGVFAATKPVVLAIVLQALWRLAGSALKTRLLTALAFVVLAANLLGVHELALLFAAGALMPILRRIKRTRQSSETTVRCLTPSILALGALSASTASAAFSVGKLYLFFLKVGSVLYGSGYVLLAFLRADLVQRWGWLTEAQLLDAITIGQVTPGPVFTTATFIGYVLGGGGGALAATVGIFLPAFFFVAISALFLTRLRRSPVASAFLDGVNAASLALMAAVTWQLGQSALTNVLSLTLFVGSAAVLMLTRLNPTWLIAAGAALGWAAF